MIQETEDDHLDQSLRDTFSDFDLPPSPHVWTGIESKLSGLPVPPRSVPLVFVLPFVGLVGVAVGWLLPRPVMAPTPRPASEVPAKTRMVSQQPATSALSAYIIPRASTEALAARKRPFPAPTSDSKLLGRSATENMRPQSRKVVYASAAQPIPAVTVSGQAPFTEASLVEDNDLLVGVTSGIEGATASTSTGLPSFVEPETLLATAPYPAITKAGELEPSAIIESLRERRLEYRVPTHRLAERGRGLRRIQNTVVKHWQRVFGPRHAGTAPKDF
jgi:hypothetical protein